MGEDPEAIRREIVETRERMGDTVDALGYKADVKSRTKDAVSDKVDSIKEKVGGATGRVSDATPSTGDVKQGARRAGGLAKENPLGLAIGATAVGFIAGLLVPTTRVEEEKLGPMASDVREKAMDAGQEALERGKQVAQDAADTARHSGQQHAQEMREQVPSSS
jgi:hypothetical protein